MLQRPRFVSGHYYLLTNTVDPTRYSLVEFKNASKNPLPLYRFYVLALSDMTHANKPGPMDSPGFIHRYSISNFDSVRTVKEVSFTELPLYFGCYTSRRYKDIFSGTIPCRTLSKSNQGKQRALARKVKQSS
jgi:hypothetical protein